MSLASMTDPLDENEMTHPSELGLERQKSWASSLPQPVHPS